MTRKQAKKKATPKPKWTSHRIGLHMKDYCHDAKKEYLDAKNYKKATARLTTRTGWTLRELEEWLATSSFKACKGNRVLGDSRAREEAKHVGLVGGAKGAKARAVRGIREILQQQVAGAKTPVVTFAMVREGRENKWDRCGGSREGGGHIFLYKAIKAVYICPAL